LSIRREQAATFGDDAHFLQPGFEFGGGFQAHDLAEVVAVVKTRALVTEHDVVGAGDAHDEVATGDAEEREQRIHVVLVGLGMVGVAHVNPHGQAEEFAAKVVL